MASYSPTFVCTFVCEQSVCEQSYLSWKKLNPWPFIPWGWSSSSPTSCLVFLFSLRRKMHNWEDKHMFHVPLVFQMDVSFLKFYYWKAFSSYTRPSWHKDTPNCPQMGANFWQNPQGGKSFGQSQISSHTHICGHLMWVPFFCFCFCIGNKTLDYLLFFIE